MKLWYRHPAQEYMSGLPIGTGRLAAMVLGDPIDERIALNHEWLWRGTYRNRDTSPVADALPAVRALLLSGDYAAGGVAANEAFAGNGGIRAREHPARVDAYQPAGDLRLHLAHGEASRYARELDLDTGLVTVSYEADGIRHTRQIVAHLADDRIYVRLAASAPFALDIALDRRADPGCLLHRTVEETSIALDGHFINGISFRVALAVAACDSAPTATASGIHIERATEVILALNVGTSATGRPPAVESWLQPHLDQPWEALVAAHVSAYQQRYATCELALDLPESQLPTDERIARLRDGESDPRLALLYFCYARYLMVASTARGQLPPNL